MKIDRVYSVIYIYNPISAGRNLAHKKKRNQWELPLPTSFTAFENFMPGF